MVSGAPVHGRLTDNTQHTGHQAYTYSRLP